MVHMRARTMQRAPVTIACARKLIADNTRERWSDHRTGANVLNDRTRKQVDRVCRPVYTD
jgi:hypothetical protein